jgi:hypothetical protein
MWYTVADGNVFQVGSAAVVPGLQFIIQGNARPTVYYRVSYQSYSLFCRVIPGLQFIIQSHARLTIHYIVIPGL